ncbi:competence protein CoiA family protein [Variovorax sp. YR216]|uniref:competence protein CoiA family protein n=1 Tax=Variovorax sp. YR216 TaxID=1882828 RepID=UPI00089962D6|nr:competence protein CoiA family protein [Variovorax sp. YR216]SEA87015.1 Competence protein CoiA-like family protein [Variovorax sp. YR216]
MKIPFAVTAGDYLVAATGLVEGAPGPFFCAACQKPVTLKQGKQRIWHFAHRAGSDCKTGFETAVHLFAKQILVEARHLRTPAMVCQVSPFGRSVTLRDAETRTWVGPGEVEKWLGGFRPDVVLPGQAPLIVEVAVTHLCDDAKRQKLSDLGIPAIEIDLSSVSRDITEGPLRELILENLECKRWIFHEGEAETLELLRAERAEEDARLAHEETEAQARRRLAEAERFKEDQRRMQALQERETERWRRARQADRRLRESSNERKLAFVSSKLGFPREWPPELDVDVRGSSAIGAPHRIWQGDLFRRHIIGSTPKGPTDVEVEFAADWLIRRYGLEPTSAKLVRIAIWDFFTSLERRGYLARKVRQRFNIRRDALRAFIPSEPPLLFWAKNQPSQKRFLEAAEASGIRASDERLQHLHAELTSTDTRLSELDCMRRVAAELQMNLEAAAAFLRRAGVLVQFGQEKLCSDR